MKKYVEFERKEPCIYLDANITYGHRREFCNAVTHPLKLSLIRPRDYFSYDERMILPVIVWLCGGAWTEMDRNVWIPELSWFAKHGYAVASVEYSVTARTRFPENVEDIKQAIRFLRAHEAEYNLDTSRIVLMGESAGGYLSALCGVTGNIRDFDKGEYLEYSSAVQAVVSWYPPVNPSLITIGGGVPQDIACPSDAGKYPDVREYLTKESPPFLILHGDADTLVNISHSEMLFEALEKTGIDTDFYVFKGAEHSDWVFDQMETKQIILDFINKHRKIK
jgi:acetyl esterase/lipase